MLNKKTKRIAASLLKKVIIIKKRKKRGNRKMSSTMGLYKTGKAISDNGLDFSKEHASEYK